MKISLRNQKRKSTHSNTMEYLKNDMSEKLKRLLQLSTEKGASNWLTKLRPLLSMVLGYQSNIFGILSVKGVAEKFQTYQQCVHLEVDLKYIIITSKNFYFYLNFYFHTSLWCLKRFSEGLWNCIWCLGLI